MLKDFITRIERTAVYRQLRTLWWTIRGQASEGRRGEDVDYFLLGYTIPRTSALLNPGLGGPPLLEKQRDIEEAIRRYTLSLEQEIADMLEAQRQAQLQALAEATQTAQASQPAAAAPVAAPDLLAGLLGL